METLWFCLVAVMIAVYVVLDGFDLGAGIIYLVRRAHRQRTASRAANPSVPFGMATKSGCWPPAALCTSLSRRLYASSFSGFYLPLMMVLWLLILRGISHRVAQPCRKSTSGSRSGTRSSALSSALLAIFFGAALGNVVRGVPLDADGYFFLPLWTNFAPQRDAGILDWYTVPIGFAAFAHAHVSRRAMGRVQDRRRGAGRARAMAARMRWFIVLLTILVLGLSAVVQPRAIRGAWLLPFAAIAIAVAGWFAKTTGPVSSHPADSSSRCSRARCWASIPTSCHQTAIRNSG